MEDKKNKNKPIKSAKTLTLWKGEFDRVGADAYVDWTIIVVFFCLFSAVLVYVGVLSYFDFNDTLSSAERLTPTSVGKIADFKGLEEVSKKFESRLLETSSLIKGYYGTTDPSL